MIAAFTLWLGAGVLVGLLAGRFIRVGAIDVLRERHDPLEKQLVNVPKPTRYYRDAQSSTETCVGCRHDDRTSGPISVVDLRPIQRCRLGQPRLWADRRCERFQEAQP